MGLAGTRQAEARQAVVSQWHDGRVKLWLIRQLLALRVERPALFAQGDYAPLPVEGPQAGHVVAFIRRRGPDVMVVVVGRHFARLRASDTGDGLNPPRSAWGDTAIVLPGDLPAAMRSALTGDRYQPDNYRLPVGALVEELPIAVLLAVRD
jgi:(1->4)-alpha-D-glucan 1-alpha-D-glucosylmutase